MSKQLTPNMGRRYLSFPDDCISTRSTSLAKEGRPCVPAGPSEGSRSPVSNPPKPPYPAAQDRSRPSPSSPAPFLPEHPAYRVSPAPAMQGPGWPLRRCAVAPGR